MYCIKCGVELADSEASCPLCFTRVYHPDIERGKADPLFPDNPVHKRQTVNRAGGLFIVTSLFVLGMLLPLTCNLQVSGAITWSGVVMGAVLLAYVVMVLPFWFKHPNPVVFLPIDFAAAGLYLLFIDLYTKGSWFLSFALPTVGGAAMIFTAVVALCKYVRRGYLYIFGGATILTGALMLLVEFLLNLTFGFNSELVWSIYPFTACLLIGAMLIIIAVSPSLRTNLQKKFFV